MGLVQRWMIISLVAVFLLPACTGGADPGSTRTDPVSDKLAGSLLKSPLKRLARAATTTATAAESTTEPAGGAPVQAASAQQDLHEPCAPHNCGSNAARVNGSVLGAVPIGGDQPNVSRFLIEPALHPREGSVAPVLGLDVRDGQIVGVNGKGEVVAMGDELKGRWFRLVRRVSGSAEGRGKIRIVDVASVRLMADRGQGSDPRGAEAIAGYELEYEPESSAAGFTEICPKAPLLWPNAVVELAGKIASGGQRLPQTLAEKMRAAAKRKATETLRKLRKLPRRVIETVRREVPLGQFTQPLPWIFALMGEGYDEISATIRPAPGALTLACPGSALSKMKLMGYEPQEQEYATTLSQRQAVIKMLTGRYCSAYTFTEDGKPLYWQNRNRWLKWRPSGTVEALWNEHGAICLNTPRHPKYTREQIVSEHCKNLSPCSESVSWENIPEGAELITITPP